MLGLCCTLLAFTALAEPYEYLTVEAKSGDGMYALLRRYGLSATTCYVDQFKHLNSLSAKHVIHAGRSYRLPVLVYTYDGRSIRSTLGIKDLALARRIQRYNRAREYDGLHERAYEKSKRLWVPYCLLFSDTPPPEEEQPRAVFVSENTRSETAKEKPKSEDKLVKGYAIFGEKYAEVKRVDKKLAGKVFYLVSGHGGPDPGAIGAKRDHTLCEDEYAYDVVLRLARNIIAHGGVPYVIVRDEDDGIRDDEFLDCDYDEVVWGSKDIPRDQRQRLRQRSGAINSLAANHKKKGLDQQYCIVVHVDSRHEETQTDLFFYHQADSKTSKELTEELRDTMDRNYRRNGRTRAYQGAVLTRDLHMLREVDVPTVYIELGNIQHSFDQKRVLRASNRQALANWWTEGLIKAL